MQCLGPSCPPGGLVDTGPRIWFGKEGSLVTMVRVGRGQPVTLFVPGGGRGPTPSTPMIAAMRWFAQDVRGTRLSFYYEESGQLDRV
jgi:hypothetical protein